MDGMGESHDAAEAGQGQLASRLPCISKKRAEMLAYNILRDGAGLGSLALALPVLRAAEPRAACACATMGAVPETQSDGATGQGSVRGT